MLEVAGSDVKSFPLDHHGFIDGVCKGLKIAECIDALLPVHEQRVVSPGHVVVTMIFNGLGFINRRLYLTPQFFENKSMARLLEAPINAEVTTQTYSA